MLEALFGTKNIQRILLFLFVNGKCYGTQLHQALNTPLTPLQKALNRLEKGGLLTSYYEGKTKLYQFNPAHPLLPELELLLKKAYTLLSGAERKDYIAQKQTRELHDASKVLFTFWNQLQTVTQLNFIAQTRSREGKGWTGKGKGEVVVTKEADHIFIFQEKGTWQTKEQQEVTFSNTFRWTLDRLAGVISLEHLRHGIDRPVFLFHLVPTSSGALASVDSHLCEGDAYFGQIQFNARGLRLNWRIIGPKKNEELDYYYS